MLTHMTNVIVYAQALAGLVAEVSAYIPGYEGTTPASAEILQTLKQVDALRAPLNDVLLDLRLSAVSVEPIDEEWMYEGRDVDHFLLGAIGAIPTLGAVLYTAMDTPGSVVSGEHILAFTKAFREISVPVALQG